MLRGEEWTRKLRFSDEDDVEDLGYGSSSFDDDDDDDEGTWGTGKQESGLWDEPEEAVLEEEEELVEVGDDAGEAEVDDEDVAVFAPPPSRGRAKTAAGEAKGTPKAAEKPSAAKPAPAAPAAPARAPSKSASKPAAKSTPKKKTPAKKAAAKKRAPAKKAPAKKAAKKKSAPARAAKRGGKAKKKK
jgi:hypothetical protein